MRVATCVLALAVGVSSLSAQEIDPLVRATGAFPPRGAATTPLPVTSFSVSRGIGIIDDDGNSYWPGYPSDLHAPATLRVVPTTSNTFTIRRVPFQFDDPSSGTVIYDGAKRPIVGFLDANYIPPAYT